MAARWQYVPEADADAPMHQPPYGEGAEQTLTTVFKPEYLSIQYLPMQY